MGYELREVKGIVFGQQLGVFGKLVELSQTELIYLLGSIIEGGLSKQSISVWKRGNNPQFDMFVLISDTLHLSYEWALKGKGPMFNLDVREAQAKMLEWAHNQDATKSTPAARLTDAWTYFSALVPSMDERVWCAYIGWVFFRNKSSDNPQLVTSEWIACKHGAEQPAYPQLKGASLVTGIPREWFETGKMESTPA